LVEETRVPRENHWQTLSHNVILSTLSLSEIRTYNISGGRHGYIKVFVGSALSMQH
jgi:hypothetical protein